MVEDKPVGEIRVSEVLERAEAVSGPVTVRTDATLREAVEAMIGESASHKVYVVDGDGRLAGTVTQEVLLRHAGYMLGVRAAGMTSFLRMLTEIADERVSQVMAKPIRVARDELLVHATQLMVDHHLNDLPVVDEDNRLVAELRGTDILRLSVRRWR